MLLQESSVVDRKKYYEVKVEVGCLGRGKCGNKLLVVEGFMGGCIMPNLKTCQIGSCCRWQDGEVEELFCRYSYQADRIAAN